MVRIDTSDDKRFELNKIPYPRIFMANKAGSDSITIYGINDKKNQILGVTHYSQLRIDGVTYNTLEQTLDALIPVLNNSSTGSGGAGGTDITNITQIPARSYNDLQDLPDLSGGVLVTDTNSNFDKVSIAQINSTNIYETVTELRQPVLDGNVLTLTYVGEDYVEQVVQVNLGGLAEIPEGGILEANYNPVTTEIKIISSDLQEYTFFLGGLLLEVEPSTGTNVTLTQNGSDVFELSLVGRTGNYSDLNNIPTTLLGHGITNAYTQTEINGFLSNKVDTAGYNKANWDTAYGWGNHALQGYITDETVTQLNTPVLVGNILTLKFLNELGVEQTTQIDLSSLTVDSSTIENGSYDPATKIITLEDTTTGDPVDIDLKDFLLNYSVDGNGVGTISQNSLDIVDISKVGLTGSYNDLLNKPTIPVIPTEVSDFNNDAGYITGLSWAQVTGKPTEFTPEAHTHTISEITDFPTNVSDFTNDAGYITSGEVVNGIEGTIAVGNSRFLANSDNGKTLVGTSPAAITLSLSPASITGDFNVNIINKGAGDVTILGVNSPTLDAPNGLTIKQDAVANIIRRTSTNVFYVNIGAETVSPDHVHDERYYTQTQVDGFLENQVEFGHTHVVADITDFPSIPTNTSDLTNDSGYLTSITWTSISGKPSSFTPSAHTHVWTEISDRPSNVSFFNNDAGYITGLSWTQLTGKPSTFTPSTHTHTISQITDFPTNVSDFTNDAGYLTSVSWGSISGKPSTFTPSTHNHDDRYYTESEIDAMLSGTSTDGHTHTVADITDFPSIPSNTSDLTNDSGFITGYDWNVLVNGTSSQISNSETVEFIDGNNMNISISGNQITFNADLTSATDSYVTGGSYDVGLEKLTIERNNGLPDINIYPNLESKYLQIADYGNLIFDYASTGTSETINPGMNPKCYHYYGNDDYTYFIGNGITADYFFIKNTGNGHVILGDATDNKFYVADGYLPMIKSGGTVLVTKGILSSGGGGHRMWDVTGDLIESKTIKEIDTSTYTLTRGDADYWLHFTSDCTISIPTNLTHEEFEGDADSNTTLTFELVNDSISDLRWDDYSTNVVGPNGVFGIKATQFNNYLLFGTLKPY